MKKSRYNHLLLPLFFFSAVIVLIIAAASWHAMMQSVEMVEESSKARMVVLSQYASNIATADELDRFTKVEDMHTPEYIDLKQRLHSFTENADILYTYYLAALPGGKHLIFIADNLQPDPAIVGLAPGVDPIELMKAVTASKKEDVRKSTVGLHWDKYDSFKEPELALSGVANAMPLGEYTKGWDGLISAFAPVYYSDGRLSRFFVGVDMKDSHILRVRDQAHTMSFLLIASIIIILISCTANLWLYMKKAKQAHVANIAKSTFLSHMSHEIRTPLNAITGLCGMAEQSSNITDIKTHLATIKLSSIHLRSVVDDILDISKIEAGKYVLETVAADLYNIIDSISGIMHPQADGRSQLLDISVDPDVPRYIYCDPVHLRQIIVNLLSNAIKFTPENGSISLSVSIPETNAERCKLSFLVKDTGIGMDKETLSRLFSPFMQGDASTTRKYGGTGLGLVISRQIINMMDGDISVTSEPGSGSTFNFYIWTRLARESDIVTANTADGSESTTLLQNKNVLLVEDNDINTIIALNSLQAMGANVDTACNGQEGFERYLASPEKYDYIFMDVQMPVMDGYEATGKIRSSGAPGSANIPIIAMTANVFAEDRQSAHNAGMNAHIGKPFDLKSIKTAIMSLAENKGK